MDNETRAVHQLTEVIRTQAAEISRLEKELAIAGNINDRMLEIEAWRVSVERTWTEGS